MPRLKTLIVGGLLLNFLAKTVEGQVTPPTAYGSGSKVNFYREWAPNAPILDSGEVANGAINEVKQTTVYLDGLGRPLQTVIKQISPSAKDMVTPLVYDEFGRKVYKYLPFVSTSAGGGDVVDDGHFKLDPFQQQAAFATNQYPNESYFYGKTDYESSPLNRKIANYSAGNNWVGAQRGVTQQYLVNTNSDSVRIWNIAAASGSLPTTTTSYDSGMLYKIVTADEQNNRVIEYKDKEGNTVLKKVQLWAAPAAGHSGWISTYFVYDDLNNLRFIIQPRAVEYLMANSWSFSGSLGTLVANELCFRYEYDTRNRMIIKKLPYAGESWIVYDGRDRMVMTQDANLRSQSPARWTVTEYDSLNRPYRTGLLTDANSRTYHQNLADNSISYPNTSSNYEELTETFYDDYGWVGSSGSGLNSSIATNHVGDGNIFNTNYNSYPDYAQAIIAYPISLGLTTGAKVKVLDSSPEKYLYTVNFYDDHGRIIQTQSTNYRDGIDTVTTQFDFSGKPLRNLMGLKKGGTNVENHVVVTKMSYDEGIRLRYIYKNIDNTGDQRIDSLDYDELGQLKTRYLGNNVDLLTYDYNIRGWMTGINRNYLADNSNYPVNYFGMEIGYDKATDATGNSYANPTYNGNIAGMIWKSAGSAVDRKYDFTYDNVNRLTGADFNQYTGGAFNKSANVDYSVSGLSYDANGNILKLVQKGLTVTTSPPIDSLSYTYFYGGLSNRLQGVKDGYNNQTTTLGDFHYNPNGKGDIDYAYDANGNLSTDYNKSITPIAYNYLNLPSLIHINGKGTVSYIYDAMGNKLAKITKDSLSRHATSAVYIGNFVYQQTDTITNPSGGTDTLQFMGHEEGRARWAYHRWTDGSSGFKWEYDFFEKDHLGNIRTVLTQQKDTAQYMATFEAPYRNTENSLFYNIPSTCVWSYYVNGSTGPNPFPTYPTNPNDSVCRISGSTPKEGPAIILKVMAGDLYQVGVKTYYKSGQTSTGTTDAISDILTSLANGIVSTVGNSKGSFTTLSNTTTSPLLGGVNAFRNDKNPTPPEFPKAYLNYMALDNQFNYDSVSSGALGVGPADSLITLATDTIRIRKNGYLYIYLTNESKNVSVFFDNLSVTHYSGPLLEETHYYPFGLTMAGISDKALKSSYPENKYRFNKGSELQNREFSDGSGLELYETHLRELDPQLGRWWQADPKPEYSQSLYSAMSDNPISFDDPLGDTATVRWRSGFLRIFGKRHDARYVGGQWIDAKSRNAINVNEAEVNSKGARRVMSDYNTLNGIRDFNPVTSAVNNATNDVRLRWGGSSETDAQRYFSDLQRGIANPTIQVNAAGSARLQRELYEDGNINTPSYIAMGHELGHVWDLLNSRGNSTNFAQINGLAPNISRSEMNAMYWENVLRMNAHLGLRLWYYYDASTTPQYQLRANVDYVPTGLGVTTIISDLTHSNSQIRW